MSYYADVCSQMYIRGLYDIACKTPWGLHQKQLESHKSLNSSEITRVGYGGSGRSGKSWLACEWLTMQCLGYNGVGYGLARRELKNLKRTTLLTLFKVFAKYKLVLGNDVSYNQQDQILTFKNGSQIFLIDTARQPSDPLYSRFGGYELTGIVIDESNETDEEAVEILYTRCGFRKNIDYKINAVMLEMFNPDKGHVYRRFYKAKKENTLKNGNIFIPALPSDNPDPAVQIWVQNQIENASSQTVERLVYGNFEYDENNDCLIERDAMFDYFKNEHVGLKGNHYLTCDIARMGNDSTVVRVWHGYVCIDVVSWYQCGLDVTAQRIKEIAIKYSIGMSRVLVDENGIGGGVVDILRCKGFLNNGKAKKGNYSNLKTECSHIIAKLINERKLYEYQSSINQRVIIEELEQCRILNVDSEGKISLIKKDKMKESLRRSPDHLDTIIMRGYFEIFKSSV